MKIHRLVFRETDRDKFNSVIDGSKSIETRAATIKFKNIAVGDRLKVVCGDDVIEKSVTWVRHYPTISKMLDNLPLTEILPTAKNRKEAIEIYHGFPGYKEKIEENGIIAFKIK